MPSPTHQNFVYVLREHPDLVVALARCAGIPLPDDARPLVDTSAEFDVFVEIGRTTRADLALAARTADGRCRAALAVEVQLHPDPGKRWSLPAYQAGLRFNLRCPVWTLVLSPDPSVRRSLVEMFADQPELRPHIVEPWMLPPIRDLDAAIADPARAVLAAVLNADQPDVQHFAKIALQATLRAPLREPWRYAQLITNAIGDATMNQIIQELPEEDREPLSDWERRGASFTRGKREGIAEGLEQGLEQGLERGLEQGLEQGLERGRAELRATVVEILTQRGFDLTPALRASIQARTDIDELRRLAIRAASVQALHELWRPDTALG